MKLIDLGVAAVAEEQLEQHDRKLTQAHEVVGTPEYMAPEQLWGREIDARTDVYAIGMSLFECLTGEVPYVGSYPEVLVQVSNAGEPPSVRDKRSDVPPGARRRHRDGAREGSVVALPDGERARARPRGGERSRAGAVVAPGAVGRRVADERRGRRSRSARSSSCAARPRGRRRGPSQRARSRRRRTAGSSCARPTSRPCCSCRRRGARSRRAARRSARRGCSS